GLLGHLAQPADVHPAAQVEPEGDVVHRVVRLELLSQPDPGLRPGERHAALTRPNIAHRWSPAFSTRPVRPRAAGSMHRGVVPSGDGYGSADARDAEFTRPRG